MLMCPFFSGESASYRFERSYIVLLKKPYINVDNCLHSIGRGKSEINHSVVGKRMRSKGRPNFFSDNRSVNSFFTGCYYGTLISWGNCEIMIF